MEVKRTKRLNTDRAKEILQLRYGTQVTEVIKKDNKYYINSILGYIRVFTRENILKIEDEMYSSFGC